MDVLTKLGNEGLIPVVVIENAGDAAKTAKALLDGGIGVMEITMRTPAGIDAIRNVKSAYPEMLTGAGTVLSLDKAKESVDAGAEFIVTPGFSDEIVGWCIENNIAITPGCVTPTEISHALSFGLNVLKFFPASVFGGLEGMKALSGPFGMVSFIPTGGVSEANLGDYADKPFIHAIGGAFLAKTADIKNGKFEDITNTAAASIGTLLGFDLAHVESKLAKEAGFGTTGSLDLRTNNIYRAIYHLQKRGIEADPGAAEEKNGKVTAICLKGGFGGYAVRLLQR